MSEAPFKSATGFRHSICASVAELQQWYTRPLPDGATVYVTALASLYRLVKGLGSAYDAITSAIVVPADQSSDRWVLESVQGASPWSGEEALLAATTVAVDGSATWAQLGSTGGSYSLMAGHASMFAVSATTGVMTYHGQTRNMMVTANVSAGTPLPDNIHAVISLSDDVPSASSADEFTKGEQAGSAGGETAEVDLLAHVSVERALLLVEGDTLRLMLRNDRGQPMAVAFFTLSVVPR